MVKNRTPMVRPILSDEWKVIGSFCKRSNNPSDWKIYIDKKNELEARARVFEMDPFHIGPINNYEYIKVVEDVDKATKKFMGWE